MCLISWFIPIKIIREIAIYLKIALSLQKGLVKCNVVQKELYRPINFCFEIWISFV